ncbi:MAG: serine/threonine-protein kinase [Pirellulaceae bacterium]
MTDDDFYSELSFDSLRRIHTLTEQFQQAIQAGDNPVIERFLQMVGQELRDALLEELLDSEINWRRRSEATLEPESYLQRFPDHVELVRRVVSESESVARRAEGNELDVTLLMATPTTPPGRPITGERDATGSKVQTSSIPDAIDGYKIIDVLGRGGMGIVYRARDARLKRDVALKMIAGGVHAGHKSTERFLAEANAVARLHHPNIVSVFAMGHHQEIPYLVLELVEGGSLDKAIGNQTSEPRYAASLVATLAMAIDYAHQNGVVHRDLKPANILVGSRKEPHRSGRGDESLMSGSSVPAGLVTSSTTAVATGSQTTRSNRFAPSVQQSLHFIPKITDFGLARMTDGDTNLTGTGEVMGTPQYMSPEQARGAAEVGPSTDIYALGVILYRLLTGRTPFHGTTPLETIRLVMEAEPAAPTSLQPGLPADLSNICLKCLEKEPGRRYQTASELADDLNRFLNHQPVMARPISLNSTSVAVLSS